MTKKPPDCIVASGANWDHQRGYYKSFIRETFTTTLGILGIAIVAHLIAYAIFGIPIFYLFYKSPTSLVWNILIALALGGILGICGICPTLLSLGYDVRQRKSMPRHSKAMNIPHVFRLSQ